MRPMESVHDLIDEAKVRAVWWCLCIFGITYFLSHTSKSMWTNIPISVLVLFALRYLSNEVEIRWKLQPVRRTFLSHFLKEQLSLDDPRLSPSPPIQRWTRKIDSPYVETAVHNFTDKILQDFVVDLWYASITPDKEVPELIRALILDVIGEISGRIKEINIVDLLTRDMVELVGNHLDLFRKNQAIIGVEVMGTLSSEERDERLKYYLMVSKELHPALMSPESEYKVLQRLIEGVLHVVLDLKETPLVRCISCELLTCLVMEPVMNFASPGYINELIELVFLDAKDETNEGIATETTNVDDFHNEGRFTSNSQNSEHGLTTSSPSSDIILGSTGREISPNIHANVRDEDSAYAVHPKSADWARVLDAATQHRTQVLAPENLENMWAKGRHYQKKAATLAKGTGAPGSAKMASGVVDSYVQPGLGKDAANSTSTFQDKHPVKLLPGLSSSTQIGMANAEYASYDLDRIPPEKGGSAKGWDDTSGKPLKKTKSQLKRSSSTSDLRKEHDVGTAYINKFGGTVGSSELYNPVGKGTTNSIMLNEGSLKMPKIKCRVVGAYFEKSGSNSFAVYSIAVTDAESKTWFVKRRYRNFERLHRHLKDIPNYTLHLPPKRFLSSSIDDYFVHQRCILLDKYLQDLLSIANIAEQHEVWDFLSSSSKNYSFGNSTSVMKTLAVNVDDAMDDIVRQFKGVSGGLRRIVGSPPSSDSLIVQVASSASFEDDSSKSMSHDNMDISHGLSDEEAPERRSTASGWHSDNELDAKCLPHRLLKNDDGSRSLESQESYPLEKLERISLDHDHSLKASSMFDSTMAVPVAVPPEWSPPNVSVPILNLVDKIFQLNRRGWIRRHVFWISKQILQLMMEDAIDDWLLRQINWLRRDDVIAQGIRWVQDVLWPNGTFFIKLDSSKESSDDSFQENQKSAQGSNRVPKSAKTLSFEQQLEAARRASDVKKFIIGGAPTTLVSLIGQRQYKRCAKDVYYFLQSTVCIKQLAYGMLEVLLLSIFPELHDLILDINQGVQTHPT